MKVGDKVALNAGRGWSSNWEILEITGETSTQWKTGASRWRKDTLYRVGRGSWDFDRIQEITPELEKEIAESRADRKHESLWRNIREIKRPYHLSVERLDAIYKELRRPEE